MDWYAMSLKTAMSALKRSEASPFPMYIPHALCWCFHIGNILALNAQVFANYQRNQQQHKEQVDDLQDQISVLINEISELQDENRVSDMNMRLVSL